MKLSAAEQACNRHYARLEQIWRLQNGKYWGTPPWRTFNGKALGGTIFQAWFNARKTERSHFQIEANGYILEWSPRFSPAKQYIGVVILGGVALHDHGDPAGALSWVMELVTDADEASTRLLLFRRAVFLSNCQIEATMHEKAEWLLFGRELGLSRRYLQSLCRP